MRQRVETVVNGIGRLMAFERGVLQLPLQAVGRSGSAAASSRKSVLKLLLDWIETAALEAGNGLLWRKAMSR